MNRILPILGILILLISCKSTKTNQESEFKVANNSVNLFAFIGEKISVIEFDPNENNKRIEIDSITGDTLIFTSYSMDNGFKNKYKVIRNVYNELKTDTIEFEAYDHYGRPAFEDYKNVLLYLSYNEEKNKYYHQKYIFDPIEKDKNGNWRGLKGESIKKLFTEQKNGYLSARGVFDSE
ncbi:hypothetical protein [Nonlabens sp. Asnod3-H03]|uniref:hypothetical protein n=1 Tax=Nonlabens sp. Asnod3-H03 TaxID=3160580 RepID=UPI00386C0446